MFSTCLATASVLTIPVVAQAGATNSGSWAIVIFCVVVGMIVTLKSSHRTSEVKRPKVNE